MSEEYNYKDPTPLEEKDYDESKVSKLVKKYTNFVRTKMFGRHVRESIARAIETIDLVASNALSVAKKALGISQDTEERLDNQIRDLTSDSEIIDLRYSKMLKKTFNILKDRGDFWDYEFEGRGVNVQWFGAVGDGVNDDAPAIRKAVEYVESLGGGIVLCPNPKVTYSCQSVNEDNSIVTLKSDGVIFRGTTGSINKDTITVETEEVAESFIHIKETNHGLQMSNLTISGSKDYKLRTMISTDRSGSPGVYLSYFNLVDIRAKYCDIGYDFSGFLGTMTSCYATFFKSIGFNIDKPNGEGVNTSLILNACYANTALYDNAVGFSINYATYCTLNSCAVDHVNTAYNFNRVKSISLNGIGCEDCVKIMTVQSFKGLSINGIFGLGLGKDILDIDEILYLMEFKDGIGCTISGFDIENNKKFTKILALTSHSFEVENITVLDGSIEYGDTYSVKNWKYQRPILILRSELSSTGFTKNVSIEIEDITSIGELINYREVNCDVIFTIKKGTQTWRDGYGSKIAGVSGSGTITIQGETTSAKDTVINQSLYLLDCTNRINFKNLTIKSYKASTYNTMMTVENSKARLDNIVFEGGGHNNGSMITAKNSSDVSLGIDVVNTGDYFTSTVMKILNADSSSSIKYDKSDTVPQNKYADVGLRIESKTSTSFEGQVYTEGKTWKKYGVTES